MGKYYDFVLTKPPKSKKELGEEIIRHLTINRLMHNKPAIFFISGDSGEGKNYTGLAIMKIINDYYGLDMEPLIDPSIIYTPLEYSPKMGAILNDKKLKKCRVVMIDEARELLNSKTWYSFINTAIADVNAMHRGVKPLVLIVVSQFFKDIDPSTRRTIQFYGNCIRPLGDNTIFRLKRLWKDERDLDRPKLRKRSIKGYIKQHDGSFNKVILSQLKIGLPAKKYTSVYDKLAYERKKEIINKKLKKLDKRLKYQLGG